jgi:hypothetical protein
MDPMMNTLKEPPMLELLVPEETAAVAFCSSVNSCTIISSSMSIAAIRPTPCGRVGWAAVAATSVPVETAAVGRWGSRGVDG